MAAPQALDGDFLWGEVIRWRATSRRDRLIVQGYDYTPYFEKTTEIVLEPPNGDLVFGLEAELSWRETSVMGEYYKSVEGFIPAEATTAQIRQMRAQFNALPLQSKCCFFLLSEMKMVYIRKLLDKLGTKNIPQEPFDVYCTPPRIDAIMRPHRKMARQNLKKQYDQFTDAEKALVRSRMDAILGSLVNVIQCRRAIDVVRFDTALLQQIENPDVDMHLMFPIQPPPNVMQTLVTPRWKGSTAKESFLEDVAERYERNTALQMWKGLSFHVKVQCYVITFVKKQFFADSQNADLDRQVKMKLFTEAQTAYMNFIDQDEQNDVDYNTKVLRFSVLPPEIRFGLEGHRPRTNLLEGFLSMARVARLTYGDILIGPGAPLADAAAVGGGGGAAAAEQGGG